MRRSASRSMRGRSTKRRLALRSLLNISNRAFYFVCRCSRSDNTGANCGCGAIRSTFTQDLRVCLHPFASRITGRPAEASPRSRLHGWLSWRGQPRTGPRPAIVMRSSPLQGDRAIAETAPPASSLPIRSRELIELLAKSDRRMPSYPLARGRASCPAGGPASRVQPPQRRIAEQLALVLDRAQVHPHQAAHGH